ncbi:PPOX class F420-dependent oxidoreductase [Kibdelosporangium philippinense]|uniref:PPOX class F420-dependent oxidoreductase n=1 Tax=Kibdelosporangium philippinense TaxID=211113 RepID=A0ABS8ZJS4_9PSEU|nr:PPOX class F420-dependent oxidoreductase [Kibdelosporangium philippinense]MCE7007393.1 PPOX class F420-dependent oxidoreductase [Kibdelosporangium philippinense]
MNAELARLADAQYVLVTTFRKDGRKVPTVVWCARDGDELIFWTRVDVGKVKRLRRNPNVEIGEADIRGKPKSEPITGVARELDAAETARLRKVMVRKYGLSGVFVIYGSRLLRGSDATICYAVTST